MNREWSWVDKKHRVRLQPGGWRRLTFIDDKSGLHHEAGDVGTRTYVHAQGQLYFGIPLGVPYLSIRFLRIYRDGHLDATGYQDYAVTSKRTLNISPSWIGEMTPEFTLAIEVKWPGSKQVVIGTRIYKGVS